MSRMLNVMISIVSWNLVAPINCVTGLVQVNSSQVPENAVVMHNPELIFQPGERDSWDEGGVGGAVVRFCVLRGAQHGSLGL